MRGWGWGRRPGRTEWWGAWAKPGGSAARGPGACSARAPSPDGCARPPPGPPPPPWGSLPPAPLLTSICAGLAADPSETEFAFSPLGSFLLAKQNDHSARSPRTPCPAPGKRDEAPWAGRGPLPGAGAQVPTGDTCVLQSAPRRSAHALPASEAPGRGQSWQLLGLTLPPRGHVGGTLAQGGASSQVFVGWGDELVQSLSIRDSDNGDVWTRKRGTKAVTQGVALGRGAQAVGRVRLRRPWGQAGGGPAWMGQADTRLLRRTYPRASP